MNVCVHSICLCVCECVRDKAPEAADIGMHIKGLDQQNHEVGGERNAKH